jgi:hypothetical protein
VGVGWRGDLKDGPQEVETLLLPRKRLSASERHLCPQAIHKKGYKTQSSLWPMGPPFSRYPCLPHYSVFLFSTNVFDLCCWSLPVLSFSERAQELWAPEIPVRVICASISQGNPCSKTHSKYRPWTNELGIGNAHKNHWHGFRFHKAINLLHTTTCSI